MLSNPISIDGNNNLVIQDAQGSHIYINSDEDTKRLLIEQADKIDEVLQVLRAQSSASFQQWAGKIYNIQQAGTINFNFYGERKIPKNLTPPPFRSEVFIGREEDLQAIHDLFFGQHKSLVLLSGPGGIGKTAFATRYCLQHQAKYTYLGWLLSTTGIEDALLRLADPLGLEFDKTTPQVERIETILRSIAELPGPILLVLDNTNDLDNLEVNYQRLRRLHNVHLLLTTRINLLDQATFYRIGSLALDQAKALFKQYYPKHQEAEDHLLELIYHAVDGNTLVIELLAKNLQQFNLLKVNYSLAFLLHDLQTLGLLAINSKEVRTDYALQKAKPEDILAAMYDLSKLEAAEKRLLSNFAILPAETIPFVHMERLLPSTKELDQLLFGLAQQGWLDYNEEHGSFRMSPVVQQIVQAKQDTFVEDGEEMIKSLSTILVANPHTGHYENLPYDEAGEYVRYGESIMIFFHKRQSLFTSLFENVSQYYRTIGNTPKAIEILELFQPQFRNYVKMFPKDRKMKLNYANSVQHLGSLYLDLGFGFRDQALEKFQLGFQLCLELGRESPNDKKNQEIMAAMLASLVQVYVYKRQFDLAKQACLTFINYAQQEKDLDPEDAENIRRLAIGFQHLGRIAREEEDFDQALKLFNKNRVLIEQLRETYPEDLEYKFDYAVISESLGELYYKFENYEEAVKFFDLDVKINEELSAIAPDNIHFNEGVARAQQFLGHAYLKLGNLDSALQAFQAYGAQCQITYERAPNNPEYKFLLCDSFELLAIIYELQSKTEDAAQLLESCAAQLEELNSANSTQIRFKLHLSDCYERLIKLNFKLKRALPLAEVLDKTILIREELTRLYQAEPYYKTNLAAAYGQLAYVAEIFKNQPRAIENYQKAFKLWDQLVKEFPSNLEYQKNLELINGTLKRFDPENPES